MVGTRGFEPPTPDTPWRRVTILRAAMCQKRTLFVLLEADKVPLLGWYNEQGYGVLDFRFLDMYHIKKTINQTLRSH